MAFWLMVMVRCLTEAPFSSVTLFNGNMLTQVLLFRIALTDARPSAAGLTSAAGLSPPSLAPRSLAL